MTPTYQTNFGDQGNCMQAAIASVLNLPLDNVPDLANDLDTGHPLWHFRAQQMLFDVTSYYMIIGSFHPDYTLDYARYSVETDGYYIVIGETNKEQEHANVWNQTGFVFDPVTKGSSNKIVNPFYTVLLRKGNKEWSQKLNPRSSLLTM